RVSLASHRREPAPDGVDREFGGVVIYADADATGVRADVIDAVGNGLAEFLVDEVMHIDVDWSALRPIIAAGVLVFADQFFLLGVDRDHRLTGSLMRFNLRVDVLELRVAIGMASAFLALAIDLTAVAEAFEQLRDAARRNAMPHVAQRRGELGVAFRHPQQRSHRIAERRRLEQTPQVFQQRRILARQRRPSAAGASNVSRDDGRRQIAQPAIDGAARYSGRPRNSGYAAKPGRTRLRRRKQATPAFVESSTQSLIPFPNRCFINHAAVINQPMAARNPPGQIDSIISRHRLTQRFRSQEATFWRRIMAMTSSALRPSVLCPKSCVGSRNGVHANFNGPDVV